MNKKIFLMASLLATNATALVQASSYEEEGYKRSFETHMSQEEKNYFYQKVLEESHTFFNKACLSDDFDSKGEN